MGSTGEGGGPVSNVNTCPSIMSSMMGMSPEYICSLNAEWHSLHEPGVFAMACNTNDSPGEGHRSS